jgi:GH25 family lysozyme M1 (1,4-beta-N-acetylmuramidase)
MTSTTRRIVVRAALALMGAFLMGGISPRAEAQLNGIDVSSYQGTVNWTSVKNAGYVFGFAKATEGTTYTDADFKSNWKNMNSAGLIRGAYHYGHPSISATEQAQYFVNAVNAAGGYDTANTLQLVLDIEDSDGLSPSEVWTWVQDFMAEIESLTGKPGIIYTGYYFWVDDVGNPDNNLNCPLWIADYGVSSPLVPTAWSTWTFWQYSDTGSVPGVSGDVDLDYFNGSLTTLKKFCF